MNFNKYLFTILASILVILIYILYISPISNIIDEKNNVLFSIKNTGFINIRSDIESNTTNTLHRSDILNNNVDRKTQSLYFAFSDIEDFKIEDIIAFKRKYIPQNKFGIIVTPYTKLNLNKKDIINGTDIILRISVMNNNDNSVAKDPIALSSNLSLETNMERFSKALIQFQKIDTLLFPNDAQEILNDDIWDMIANVAMNNGYQIIINGFDGYKQSIKNILYKYKIHVIEPHLVFQNDSKNITKELDALLDINLLQNNQITNLFISIEDSSLMYIIGEWIKKNEQNFNYFDITQKTK